MPTKRTETFAETVSADLIDALKQDWERFELMTPFQRERERQWAFIDEKSVVAIDGAGFPSRGKSGVLYTGEGLFSSEVQKGAILKYSKIGSVSKRDDGLLFKMRDGSERVLRFGDYQDSVYEVLTRLIKMRSSR